MINSYYAIGLTKEGEPDKHFQFEDYEKMKKELAPLFIDGWWASYCNHYVPQFVLEVKKSEVDPFHLWDYANRSIQ